MGVLRSASPCRSASAPPHRATTDRQGLIELATSRQETAPPCFPSPPVPSFPLYSKAARLTSTSLTTNLAALFTETRSADFCSRSLWRSPPNYPLGHHSDCGGRAPFFGVPSTSTSDQRQATASHLGRYSFPGPARCCSSMSSARVGMVPTRFLSSTRGAVVPGAPRAVSLAEGER